MAEPDRTFRWQPPAARRAVPRRVLATLLALLALAGGALAASAGHAWLRLLSECSRWLLDSSPAEQGNSAAQPPEPARAGSASEVPPAPQPRAPAALSGSAGTPGRPSSASEQSNWPGALEYGGAACAGVFVYAVTLDEQAPRRSAVSLATSSSARGKYARPGQRVEDWEVLGISDDWTGANPVVWLAREREVCRASLTGNSARVEAVQREARQREAQLRQEARRRREERRRRRARRRR